MLTKREKSLMMTYCNCLSNSTRRYTRWAVGPFRTRNRSHLLISDVTVSKSLCFHLSTLRRSVFKTPSPLLKLFSKGIVIINVYAYLSVDNRQKRIKKYTFPNETAVVQRGTWGRLFSAFLRRQHTIFSLVNQGGKFLRRLCYRVGGRELQGNLVLSPELIM